MGCRKNNPRLVQQMIAGIGTTNIDEFEKNYCLLNNDDKIIVNRAINMLMEANTVGYDVEFQNEEDDDDDIWDDRIDDNDQDDLWGGPMDGGWLYFSLGEGYEGDEYWKREYRSPADKQFLQELYERIIRTIDKVINDGDLNDDDDSRKEKGSAVLTDWIDQFQTNK